MVGIHRWPKAGNKSDILHGGYIVHRPDHGSVECKLNSQNILLHSRMDASGLE